MTDKELLEKALIETLEVSNKKNNKKLLAEESAEFEEYLNIITKDEFKKALIKIIEEGIKTIQNANSIN